MVARAVARLTAPLARRVRLMVRRAVVKLVYDDPKMQELQLALFAGEIRDNIERWEDYGLTSHPIPGAEALVLALGGSTDHSAVVKVGDRRYRLTGLAEGEVALYDDQGQVVHLKRGREVQVYGTNKLTATADAEIRLQAPIIRLVGSSQVRFETPTAYASSLLFANGNVQSASSVLAGNMVQDYKGTMYALRQTYNSHTHPENGDGGGTTSAPNQPM